MSDAKGKQPRTHTTPAPPTGRTGLIPWPPVVYALGIAASLVLHAIYPLPWFGSPMSDILVALGWLALLATAALLVTAIRTMRAAKTTLNPNAQPDHLVTGGPFGVSRNPMYLGNTLLLLGVGLVTGITWFLPVAILAAFVTQKVAIEKEERWLAEKFGKRYRDYAKRVRRWI